MAKKRPPPPGPVRITKADSRTKPSEVPLSNTGAAGNSWRLLVTCSLLLLLLVLVGGIYYAAVEQQPEDAKPNTPVAAKRVESKQPRTTEQPKTNASETPPKAEAGPTQPVKAEVQQSSPQVEPVAADVPSPPSEPLGLYSKRTQQNREQWIAQEGGTKESELGVAAGLEWLARHQADDGHWGPDCLGTNGLRCDMDHPCDKPGGLFETAFTGLSVLAFQAGGNYGFNNRRYSSNVRRGLDWLVARQGINGEIVGSHSPLPPLPTDRQPYDSRFMYEHAIATFALAEACALARAAQRHPDEQYLAATIKAVKFIEEQQHDDGGWRYTIRKGERSDTSISGWVMLALKTANEADINVDRMTLSRMTAFFKHLADPLTGRTFYQGLQYLTDATTGVGMMVDEFVNHATDTELIHLASAYLADRAEQRWGAGHTDRPDFYLWYNCTLAMFMAGGEPWQRWNDVIRNHLLALQVHGAQCDRGSWDPDGQWGSEGGRIFSTALAVLTLEVYYRFARENEGVIDGTRYLPLKLGREARYQVTFTPPIGKPRQATATNKTAERTTINGKQYYKVTTTITGVPFMPDTFIYYRSSPEGIYQVLEGDEKSPEWLYLPAKIEIGDTWGAKTPSGDFHFKAVGVEDVVTPSRKYPQCLKLSVTMKKTLATNTQEQWLAAGVGSVKQTDSNPLFSAVSILEEVKEPKK